MAGAVLGASRKGCGAPGRRGPRLLSVRQAQQYLELPERVAARLVAVGRGSCLCGRRSTWSLEKGLRRAWSPWAAAPVCVAGAVLGASRKGCGALGRRGPRLLFAWQAQYLELPERVAARLVAVGRGSCLCGRRSTWSFQKGLRRAQDLELPERVAARLVAVGRGSCLCGRRSTWSFHGAPGRRGPRLLSVWQAQYLELPERVAARLLSVWQAQYLKPPERVAARLVAVGRGSCLWGRRSTWSLQKGLRRAWSPGAAAPVCVAGAVLGASTKICGAPGRRGPRLLSVW